MKYYYYYCVNIFLIYINLIYINASDDLDLYYVSDEIALKHKAACIDGSKPAFYMKKEDDNNNWICQLHGGGWSYDEAQSYHRSKTILGTSNNLNKHNGYNFGLLTSDKNVNPITWNYNKVLLHYCDGGSFSGLRDYDDPVIYNGTKLYFRGRANLDAIFDELKTNHNFSFAEQVILSGTSAGGLATYLHADYIKTLLPKSVSKYGVVPMSGYFLNHTNANNSLVYPSQMKYLFNMMQSSNGVNEDCIKSKSPQNRYQCIMAQEAYKFIKSPIFIINSVYDSWQMDCILTSKKVPSYDQSASCGSLSSSWHDCVRSSQLSSCSSEQISDFVDPYGKTMLNYLLSTPTINKKGNGAFLSSCVSHVAADGFGWTTYEVDGEHMNSAVYKWWQNITTSHLYLPCTLNTERPYQCNPTCTKSLMN